MRTELTPQQREEVRRNQEFEDKVEHWALSFLCAAVVTGAIAFVVWHGLQTIGFPR